LRLRHPPRDRAEDYEQSGQHSAQTARVQNTRGVQKSSGNDTACHGCRQTAQPNRNYYTTGASNTEDGHATWKITPLGGGLSATTVSIGWSPATASPFAVCARYISVHPSPCSWSVTRSISQHSCYHALRSRRCGSWRWCRRASAWLRPGARLARPDDTGVENELGASKFNIIWAMKFLRSVTTGGEVLLRKPEYLAPSPRWLCRALSRSAPLQRICALRDFLRTDWWIRPGKAAALQALQRGRG
jgi:hypothetical protein